MFQPVDKRSSFPKTYSRRTSTIIDESSKRPRTENASVVAKSNPELQSPMEKKIFLGLSDTKTRTDIRNYLRPATSISGTLDTDNWSTFSSTTRNNKKKRRLRFTAVDTQKCHSKNSVNRPSITRLTQRTIANVDRDFVNCKVCGMVYTFWEEESHSRFHKKIRMEFQPLIKCKKATIFEQEFESKMLCIQVLDRNSERVLQNLGEIALKYSSDNGLEMEPIASNNLWGLITNPHNPGDPDKVLHFKLYVMFHQSQLIALLLAERVGYAGKHCESTLTRHNDSSKQEVDGSSWRNEGGVSLRTHRKVFMSIERIWVRQNFQRKGLATLIIDKARENFLYPLTLPKHQIAISWPTRDGFEFLDKYFRGVFNVPSFDDLVPYLVNAEDSASIT